MGIVTAHWEHFSTPHSTFDESQTQRDTPFPFIFSLLLPIFITHHFTSLFSTHAYMLPLLTDFLLSQLLYCVLDALISYHKLIVYSANRIQ